jgi:tetratricopeptide (TPR) repeat protein
MRRAPEAGVGNKLKASRRGPGRAAASVAFVGLLVLGSALPLPARADDKQATPAELKAVDSAIHQRTVEDSVREAVKKAEGLRNLYPKDIAPLVCSLEVCFALADEYLEGDAASDVLSKLISDGLAGLSVQTGESFKTVADLDAKRDKIGAEQAGMLYWTTVAYGRTIEDLSVLSQPGAARRFHRLLKRLEEIDEKFCYGGPHRLLGEFMARAPGMIGGDDDEALAHAKRAVEIDPDYAWNHVVLGMAHLERGDERLARPTFKEAMTVAQEKHKDLVAEQRRAYLKARTFYRGMMD